MHQKLFNVGAMRLIGRRGKIKLHGSDDLSGHARKENSATSRSSCGENLVLPKCIRIVP